MTNREEKPTRKSNRHNISISWFRVDSTVKSLALWTVKPQIRVHSRLGSTSLSILFRRYRTKLTILARKETIQSKKSRKEPMNTQTLIMNNRQRKAASNFNSHNVSISWIREGFMMKWISRLTLKQETRVQLSVEH